jgi:threonine-phosphate decarboxylase
MVVTHGGNLFEICRERGWDWRDVLDFSASINPLGPCPAVFEAIRGALHKIEHYPEREPARLRRALADLWQVDEARILLGNGATELLHFFARIEPYERVTLAVPAFSEFHRAYPGAATVPADDPRQWPAGNLLIFTQPNNPTGQPLCPQAMQRSQPVLIDESFLEFTGLPSSASSSTYVLRSLTKFYALPGLRVGALIAAADVVTRWRERREPWQVNVLAEEAALAAIADLDHARGTLEFVATERAWLLSELQSIPAIAPMPSVANYLFVRTNYSGAALCRHFLDAKILIRNCTGIPGVEGEAVRIAVRTRPENQKLIARWKEFACAP